MRALAVGVSCSAILLCACTGRDEGGSTSRPEPSVSSPESPASASPGGAPSASPSHAAITPASGEFVPAASRAIPRAPGRLAAMLGRTTRSLRVAIDRWVVDGRPSPPRPPADIELLALYQQRIYRLLGMNPLLARGTLALLPRGIAGPAAANVGAARELLSLITPVGERDVPRVQPPELPGRLLGFFQQAGRRFGVDWELLAAVMLVESKFGRTRSASTAGAQGPMQFIPSTWAAYGLDGDVRDPHDAILGAANYLSASGASRNERRALLAYNHAGAYVDAVEAYAGQMRLDPANFFVYYNWQVFVRTTSGDRRLTGPGLS